MIVWLDMHIRDERVLSYIKQHQDEQIPAHVIAREFKCCENTAKAIIRRLINAGLIERISQQHRGGFVYHVIVDEVKNA
jgi:predicted transcriptional regulator